MKILVAPLDWGLGHATRCTPIIRALRDKGHEVVIGADGRGLDFLVREFPEASCLRFPGHPMRYSGGKSGFALLFLRQLPGFLWSIHLEHHQLKKWVTDRNIEMVISDNRYGLYSRQIPCIFITHQLCLKFPHGGWGMGWFLRLCEKGLSRYIGFWLKRFDQVWVPDVESSPNLSGELGHLTKKPPNLFYIGPLSRFSHSKEEMGESASSGIDYLGIVSGPEPQRTKFAGLLREQFQMLPGRRILILGKPEEKVRDKGDGAFSIYPHLPSADLSNLLRVAKTVVCRPGYSLVMELAGLRAARIIFVPTPGQTEQEYLAAHLKAMGVAPWVSQGELSKLLSASLFEGYSGFSTFSFAGMALPELI